MKKKLLLAAALLVGLITNAPAWKGEVIPCSFDLYRSADPNTPYQILVVEWAYLEKYRRYSLRSSADLRTWTTNSFIYLGDTGKWSQTYATTGAARFLQLVDDDDLSFNLFPY